MLQHAHMDICFSVFLNHVQMKFVLELTFFWMSIRALFISYEHCEEYCFPRMSKRNDALRKELIGSARPELKSILELCLSVKEGNLKLPRKNSYRSIIMTLAN